MAQQNMTDDERAYAAEFDEDMGAPAAAPEGDGMGITPTAEDAPSASDGATAGEPAAVTLTADAVDTPADASTDAAPGAAGDDDVDPDPKEEQRRKSWEGRLRAREAELAEREAKLGKPDMPRAEDGEQGEQGEGTSQAIEQAAEQLEASGDQAGADKVEQVAEQVESGDLTAEQAMKILSEDFGPEFVKMIEVIAGSKAQAAASKVAQEATGQLSQSVQEIIDTIVDDKARGHFEAIAAKHPDFVEVAATPEFEEFKRTYENGEQIASNGSAKDINKMLDAFKATQKPAEPEKEDPAVAAAEGVRSSGLRLPEAPVKAEGYESAWDQF